MSKELKQTNFELLFFSVVFFIFGIILLFLNAKYYEILLCIGFSLVLFSVWNGRRKNQRNKIINEKLQHLNKFNDFILNYEELVNFDELYETKINLKNLLVDNNFGEEDPWKLINKNKVIYYDSLVEIFNGILESNGYIQKSQSGEFENIFKYQEVNNLISQHFENYRKIDIEKKKKYENYLNIQKEELTLFKNKYFEKEVSIIEAFHYKILENITYHDKFKKELQVFYNKENKMLIIDYLLPEIEQIPNIKDVKFIKTRSEYKNIYYSDRELNKIYDDVLYQLTLDIIRITFQYDEDKNIKSLAFNGWSNAINKATGLRNKACILSIVCEKEEFQKINLALVDAKTCFKSLKGISANKLYQLTPIKPIIQIETKDKRFIEGKEVEVDSKTNLASMDWQDFEHLIREVFEKEFQNNGGEVKVTRSSRDGGVDAIAFDPDPIRGGKIVIQAKRYTNTVGVSAVRDLYGTVLNEGAIKGILVTTSDYGSDSYNFAKDKPISLMNGANLLYLLEKHRYQAKIDIEEAKNELRNEKNT